MQIQDLKQSHMDIFSKKYLGISMYEFHNNGSSITYKVICDQEILFKLTSGKVLPLNERAFDAADYIFVKWNQFCKEFNIGVKDISKE